MLVNPHPLQKTTGRFFAPGGAYTSSVRVVVGAGVGEVVVGLLPPRGHGEKDRHEHEDLSHGAIVSRRVGEGNESGADRGPRWRPYSSTSRATDSASGSVREQKRG